MRKPRAILLILVLLSAGFCLWYWVGRPRPGGERTPPAEEEGRRPDLTIRKFHYTEREGGEPRWEIRADQAERFLDRAEVHMEKVEMRFFREGNEILVSGRRGDYFEKERRVEIVGDVRVRTATGYSLYTDHLTWEQDQALLQSREPVRLVTAQYTIKGDRMRYRADLRRVEVLGNVRAVISAAGPKGGGD